MQIYSLQADKYQWKPYGEEEISWRKNRKERTADCGFLQFILNRNQISSKGFRWPSDFQIVPEIRRDQWIKHFIKRFTGPIRSLKSTKTEQVWQKTFGHNPFKSTIAWMESIVTLQSSRPVVHGSSESSWIFTIIHSPKIWWIAMELGILGEFWEHFPNLSEPQAVQPIARQIMEGVQQLHDFGIVLAYGIHQLCWMKISCCGILVEKLEKWRSG